ncbi:hypothetical protein SAMN02745126_01253 [Enhydrobacter aerosaccus]|uniref:Uncharacterized protein n=1 Tax=Enhydrobacter aerosaccus TaxID=225324 RepID=A0A1T4KZ13_9HYPH|nr:hypothetical protein [Enhydrobacter aerosaccus]SJZ47705.1 hypothetical protein SAMN02745126_01253 [Enhydrobacter aerosaccus]
MTSVVPFLTVLLLAVPVFAQVNCTATMEPIDTAAPSQMSPVEFTHAIAAREIAMAKAFATYGYIAEIDVQTLQGDVVDGAFHRKAKVGFDASGTKAVKNLEPVTNTLTRLRLSDKDVEGLVSPPFAITADNLAEKDAVYSGRQLIDDHNTSVFDLLPRNEQAPVRGFIGRVWVWTSKSTVLKTCGRSSGFPVGPFRYEIVRGKVGEENWFPVLIRADEDMRVGDNDVHVRVTAKYSDYAAR